MMKQCRMLNGITVTYEMFDVFFGFVLFVFSLKLATGSFSYSTVNKPHPLTPPKLDR